MKKAVIGFCVMLFSISFAYAQTEVGIVKTNAESGCESSLENIFKVSKYKEKFQSVEYLYQNRERSLFLKNHLSKYDSFLNRTFKSIKGYAYFEEQTDSIPSAESEKQTSVEMLSPVEMLSKEALNKYIDELNYTPQEAYKDYENFIQTIKFDKEHYLRCIDAELAKGNASDYAREFLYYDFIQPLSSLLPPRVSKLDFLKIFKEFNLLDDSKVLPDFLRVMAYLECGCKIPYYWEFARRYKVEN